MVQISFAIMTAFLFKYTLESITALTKYVGIVMAQALEHNRERRAGLGWGEGVVCLRK